VASGHQVSNLAVNSSNASAGSSAAALHLDDPPTSPITERLQHQFVSSHEP
jgi:hypothetical protein